MLKKESPLASPLVTCAEGIVWKTHGAPEFGRHKAMAGEKQPDCLALPFLNKYINENVQRPHFNGKI